MAQTKKPGKWDWLNTTLTTRQEAPRWVLSQMHSLNHTASAGYISPKATERFQKTTGLTDFSWRMYYHRRPKGRVQPVTDVVANAQGYIIFMHGWCGSHVVWEDLPALVCEHNPNLVCFAADVNGFGGTPFCQAENPPLQQCGPHSDMQAVEQWLDVLKIHRPGRQRQVFTFVGHSMSGAALFHKSHQGWEENRYSLLALAPAMLHKDTVKQAFYKTMGMGIGTGTNFDFMNRFKNKMSGPVMEMLAANAGKAVKKEHARIFKRTPKGTISRTFYALGMAEETPCSGSWNDLFVMLGHKDRLVALGPTLDLLESMGLTSENIRVMMGDHYFFSISQQSRRLHGFNRSELLHHILHLHEQNRARND